VIPGNVFAETLLQFFAPIRSYLDDQTVSDIVINGPFQVFVERRGKLELTPARFETSEDLTAALRNVAQFVGKQVDEQRPILEARLPSGARLQAVFPPAAPDGPHVAIRKFPKSALTTARLVDLGALTPVAAQTLHAFVSAKLNVVIAGGTGSGKTSLLNALSAFIPEGERVVVIEDSKEVQLQRPHVVQLEARPPDAKGRGEVTIRDLFRATLRMRPDRIVIGEIRGGEALDIIQAMTSGHGGCLGTLHATHPRDTLSRLETMSMMSNIDMPLAAMRMQIASAVNLIVQIARMRDGSRKVTHVTEVLGFDVATSTYQMQDLFVRDFGLEGFGGAVSSELVPTGALPACLPQLRAHGVELPPAYDEYVRQTQTAARTGS
jgi:pilus assembly protein CpaF